MPQPAFAKPRCQLALPAGRVLTLEPPDAASAGQVAEAICRLDPWLTLQTRPERLRALLLREDPHCYRHIMRLEGALAGVVVIRSPWLYGPYLNLLAVLPPYQHSGIGSAILAWIAGAAEGNLWVCASEFNARAIAFYERHGFHRVALLPDLVVPGFAEVLLRKRLK
jgi:GNAT superfamily N-acetyltransferase